MKYIATFLGLALIIVAPMAIAGHHGDKPHDHGKKYTSKYKMIKQSPHSVSTTIDRLEAVITAKGLNVFTRIDHAKNAEKAGLSLRPAQVLIFGNPKVGTKLMKANPHIALDLPMKALAFEDENGQVHLEILAPTKLKKRYRIEGHDELFTKMTGALEKFMHTAVAAE